MKLYYNTVSPTLKQILDCLMRLDSLKDFRLVGGTSLALQRGHRRSIDIDMFTDIDYDTMPLDNIRLDLEKSFPIHKDLDSLEESALGYSLRLGFEPDAIVKLDLFYTEKYKFDVIVEDGIRLADEREIASMKLLAIGNGSYRQKDYWDIRELLDSYSLEQMIQWTLSRYPYEISESDIIDALQNTHLVQESPEGIDSLRSLDYWELKQEEIKDAVNQFICNKRNLKE